MRLGARHPLRAAIGDLATAAVTRLTLPPLSLVAVHTLLAGSALDPVAMHGRTGGNPCFVTELLASEAAGMPATVRDAVLARTARLSDESRAVLEAAAIIGARAETWLLTQLLSQAWAR